MAKKNGKTVTRVTKPVFTVTDPKNGRSMVKLYSLREGEVFEDCDRNLRRGPGIILSHTSADGMHRDVEMWGSEASTITYLLNLGRSAEKGEIKLDIH